MLILVLGTIGAGKGTQSRIISQRFLLPLVDVGALLRQEPSLKPFLKKGKLVPDNFVLEVIEKFLASHDISKGVVFDGFPRSPKQIGILEGLIKKYNLGEPLIIYIKLPKEKAIARLHFRHKTNPRIDDDEKAMATRFWWSERSGKKVIELLALKYKLLEIDGRPSILKIATDIEEKLKKYIGKNNS